MAGTHREAQGSTIRWLTDTGASILSQIQVFAGATNFGGVNGVAVMTYDNNTHIVSGLWNDFGVGNSAANFQKLTQAEFDGITPDDNTIYFIVG